MNFGLTYLQGKIKSATNSWNSALQEDNGAILIRKANKINTVLDMMSFWQSEWDLKFSDSSSEQKSVINGKYKLFQFLFYDFNSLALTQIKIFCLYWFIFIMSIIHNAFLSLLPIENNYSESKEEFCFQSWTAKTFEVKQIESFMYDKYWNNSDIE